MPTGTGMTFGHLAVGLSHPATFASSGSRYIAGGRRGARTVATLSLLDPGTAAMSRAANLPDTLSYVGVATLPGHVYDIDGEAPKPSSGPKPLPRRCFDAQHESV
ncbi:MAG: Kelch repeat-containing protein [Acidimicrobiales bacterium]